MKPIFETCNPREEVLRGELKDEIFAARLKDVMDGKAEAVYQDPQTFFDNTYPTAGLKTLLAEALGRLTGNKPASSPIIRLEAAFGGGETHNLIALYHSCNSHIKSEWIKGLLDPKELPSGPIKQIAGVVGSDLDPDNGLKHVEVTTFTPWGEIAYQLGGLKGYRIVEKSDKHYTAPGAPTLGELVGEQPALIMIDEVARFMRVAKGKRVVEGTLADQTVAFLMALLEMAASKAKVVVVYTLATAGDAFAKETEELQQELAEAKKVSARQERIITPTGETEMAAIVTHRLFRHIDRSAAQETADAYSAYFRELVDKRTDLPQQGTRAEYAQEMTAYYPFHPELLNTLNRKTATIPNFQKTRGALRLLAMTIRRLWEEKPQDAYLIHPHYLDLSNEDILNDLTSRLERPVFRNVVEADIVSPLKGSRAHAQIVDEPLLQSGKPPYARRASTAIFLHSLTQGIASGVDPSELRLGVLQPGDDPALVDKALDRLVNDLSGGGCWFLDWDGRHYRFKTEPSLNKLIADEMQIIGNVKAKTELDSRIKQVWKKGAFLPIYFPTEAAEVGDDADAPKLCVIHYDAATTEAGDKVPPELVIKIFEHAGSMEGYRTYKNNVLFLTADKQQVEHMVEVAQRYLAIRRITGDSDRMSEFNDEPSRRNARHHLFSD